LLRTQLEKLFIRKCDTIGSAGTPTRRCALEFQVVGTNETFALVPRAVVIAGYTGKDRAAVDRHIQELAEAGLPPGLAFRRRAGPMGQSNHA